VEAVSDVSIHVDPGEFVSIIGPSGCGKSTLLNAVAGFLKPTSGTVLVDGDPVNGPSAERGMVFQQYSLFPWKTVRGNVEFGLKMRGMDRYHREHASRTLLGLAGLLAFEDQYPDSLSGGMKQRVGIVRALATGPKVLLLDEPFGALDAQVRQELRQWLRRLHQQVGVTTILVTHDQEEAFEVADHVVILNKGKVEQAASPLEVFEHPASAFVMDFLGRVNVFHGRARNGRVRVGEIDVPYPEYLQEEEKPVTMYVRPHELDIEPSPNGTASLAARVLHVNPAGAVARIHLEALEGKLNLHVEVSPERWRELQLSIGDTAYVSPRRARVFLPEYSI
jgi:sulfate/thiosulfate transport system ATP-binding protein